MYSSKVLKVNRICFVAFNYYAVATQYLVSLRHVATVLFICSFPLRYAGRF